MINIRLKKTIVAAILASMLTTASVYTTSNLLQVNAAEADGELTVLAQSLWTYSKADWNARTKIVNSGEKFTLFEKVVIAGREMYGLTNGLYITANPKYISTNESLSVSKPASVPSTYSMTLYNLNLRKGIGTSQGIITTMPKGSKVQILQTKDGWSELRYNGVTGWASSQFLGNTASEPAPPKVETLPSNNTIKVTTANLSMRQGPSTSYGRITVIPVGSQVECISSSNGWDKVVYQGKTGYSSTNYLKSNQNQSSGGSSIPAPVPTPTPVPKPVPTPTPTPTPSPNITLKTTTYNLQLRDGPSTSHNRVIVIPKGSQVESRSSSSGWDQVVFQGKSGYAASAYLKVTSQEAPKPVITKKYTTGNLSLRKGPSASNGLILVIPKGTMVESSSSVNGWDQITYLGTSGYASSAYLSTEVIVDTKVNGSEILEHAKTFLGLPYIWGGNSPDEGFDCSGLIKYVYANFGYQTPRVSYQQAEFGREVSMDELQIGDILYFGNSKVSHTAIYAGDNTMLHAPRPDQFVEIRDIGWHVDTYEIVGARRYLD